MNNFLGQLQRRATVVEENAPRRDEEARVSFVPRAEPEDESPLPPPPRFASRSRPRDLAHASSAGRYAIIAPRSRSR